MCSSFSFTSLMSLFVLLLLLILPPPSRAVIFVAIYLCLKCYKFLFSLAESINVYERARN